MIRRVYVAGPISKGDQFLNIRAAMVAAAELMAAGFEPFVPHLLYILHMHAPQGYERWMQLDFAWLEVSDALLLLPGESLGADREVEWALERGIPVFRSVDELKGHERRAPGPEVIG